MSRTKDIISRVYRNLQKEGIAMNTILDQEIFDELVLGQDRIISDAFPDQIVRVTFQTGINLYALTTDTTVPDLPEKQRANVASVKIIKLPSGWSTSDGISDYGNISMFPEGFSVVPTDLFIEAINANQGLTGRPRIGTIVGGKLEVYPVPTIEENGVVLELYVYLSSSSGIINDTNEPEIPNYYDKALEIYATAQFQVGDSRTASLIEFQREVGRVRSIYNRKHHNLARKPITGFL